MGVSEEIRELPYVDEHAVEVGASPARTWKALEAVAEGSFGGGARGAFARAVGCDETAPSGPRPLARGSTIVGFHVAIAEPGRQLALVGRHHFSSYALVFHLDAAAGAGEERTRLRAETRAAFPGFHGRAYRALVIGSRGHVLITRRLLAAVKARAERRANPYDRAMSGETLQLTPHESLTIRSATAEALEVEARYGTGKPPPKHYHPSQDEHFEVLEGSIHVTVDGAERTLAAGETVAIPRGTAHQVWNPAPAPARVLWRTSPPGRTEQWFRALDAVRREGKVGKDGMPGPLAFGVYLSEYRDVFRLAGPDWLLRPALAGLGVIGRARGYRA